MIIVGTKFFGHDSAACVIDTEQQRICAASSERFTRIKHDGTFCDVALQRLLDRPPEVVAHAFSDFSNTGFQEETTASGLAARRLEHTRRVLMNPRYRCELEAIDEAEVERVVAMTPALIRDWHANIAVRDASPHSPEFNRACIEDEIRTRMVPFGGTPRIVFHDHHLCHAYSALATSPFLNQEVLAVSFDGQGDGYFSKAFLFDGWKAREVGCSAVVPIHGLPYPASLGWIYSIFTLALGFRPSSDEGKVEALAAFGSSLPTLLEALHRATRVSDTCVSFEATAVRPFLDALSVCTLIRAYSREDVAATLQRYLEETVVNYLNRLATRTGAERLVLSGGVVANIILNLAIYERTPFKQVHICPFMGDEGSAVGAAVLSANAAGSDLGWLAKEVMPYWGTCYSRDDVRNELAKRDGIIVRDLGGDWTGDAAADLSDNQIIAIFQGRMEFGPRALGHRSILANPADPNLRERMNVMIKRRPPWQPFCPSMLDEERERLFLESFPHRHMAIAFRMRPEHEKALPAAVHVDGTARPQCVTSEDDATFHELLSEVKRLTGYGVVINTSFNLHGRAIVEHPQDAIDDFLDCNLDALYIEGFKVTRAQRAVLTSVEGHTAVQVSEAVSGSPIHTCRVSPLRFA